MGKLVLVIFAEHHYQVSPLPVESSLPPINWDNIKAKWVLQPPITYSCDLRYPTVTPWTPGSKPGLVYADSLALPAPVPHPGYKKGTKR